VSNPENRDEQSAGQIAERIAEEIEDVLSALKVRFVRPKSGRSIVAWCPWNHPARGDPKLYIDIKRNLGAWIEFRSGAKGDALWLVAMILSGGRRDRDALGEALSWARDRYGIGKPGFDRDKWERQAAENRRRAQAREQQYEAELAKDRRRAQAQWLKALPLKEFHHGFRYLQARGVDFKYLGKLPGAVRFEPQARYYEDGAMIHIGPALCTAMTQADGSFGAVHRTFLDPGDVAKKLDLGVDSRGRQRPARKMWPSSHGCVIRLWRGSSGLSEKEAVANGLIEDVIVCEGVEDGLSLAMIDPKKRIIAAGSLSGLMSLTPPACADTLTIAADNDWGKPQAQAQLDAAVERFAREFRLTVRIARSPEGKDFNDLIRGNA